jgi:hypothetical protein
MSSTNIVIEEVFSRTRLLLPLGEWIPVLYFLLLDVLSLSVWESAQSRSLMRKPFFQVFPEEMQTASNMLLPHTFYPENSSGH